jgi:hypothetical protein
LTYIVEYFPSYEQTVDFVYEYHHEDHFVEDNNQLVKKQTVISKCLVIDIEDRKTFFVHDNMQDYIFLNYGQEISLQEEIQQANKREHIFVLAYAKKFFAQGDNQQSEKYFVVHDYFEECDIYGMFQGGQDDYSLVNRA